MEKLDSDAESIHTNIRVLLARAEQGIVANDFPATIHACASVFETLAKDIISDTAIDDKPLGGFFLKYKKNSNLPEPILDFMINQYNLRNTTPLAGHGSRLAPPIISKEEATLLVELTKAFVKTEYKLLSKGVVTIPLAPTRG